jgi:hypothetical protein
MKWNKNKFNNGKKEKISIKRKFLKKEIKKEIKEEII